LTKKKNGPQPWVPTEKGTNPEGEKKKVWKEKKKTQMEGVRKAYFLDLRAPRKGHNCQGERVGDSPAGDKVPELKC